MALHRELRHLTRGIHVACHVASRLLQGHTHLRRVYNDEDNTSIVVSVQVIRV